MIWAFECAALDDFPQRQPGAAVNAQVAPGEVVLARTPQHDLFAQKTCAKGAASRELLDARHGVPIVDEDGIVDHLSIALIADSVAEQSLRGFSPSGRQYAPEETRLLDGAWARVSVVRGSRRDVQAAHRAAEARPDRSLAD